VSKHLWERHSLPAKDRAGLNAFVRGLDLPDPNTIASKQDGSEVLKAEDAQTPSFTYLFLMSTEGWDAGTPSHPSLSP
jgi:hypothetical protein